MCATRSNNSWDIVVHKIADKLFLDKRDNTFGNSSPPLHFFQIFGKIFKIFSKFSNSFESLDLLTVNETSNELQVEDPEMLNTLSLEATFICNNFSQQVLKTVSLFPHLLKD